MNPQKLLFIALFCVLCFSSCKKETEVSGEVFIVTKGAENIKLGGVSVSVIPENLVKGHIEGLKPEFEREIAEAKKLLALCSQYSQNLEGLSVEQIRASQNQSK